MIITMMAMPMLATMARSFTRITAGRDRRHTEQYVDEYAAAAAVGYARAAQSGRFSLR